MELRGQPLPGSSFGAIPLESRLLYVFWVRRSLASAGGSARGAHCLVCDGVHQHGDFVVRMDVACREEPLCPGDASLSRGRTRAPTKAPPAPRLSAKSDVVI